MILLQNGEKVNGLPSFFSGSRPVDFYGRGRYH